MNVCAYLFKKIHNETFRPMTLVFLVEKRAIPDGVVCVWVGLSGVEIADRCRLWARLAGASTLSWVAQS